MPWVRERPETRRWQGGRFLSWLAVPVLELRLGMREPPSVVDVIAEISPRPILLITTDELETKVVRRYFEFAKEPKTLGQIPETGHGGGFAARKYLTLSHVAIC